MNTGLHGKIVLVTEAVRNFGRVTALEFAKEGANLLLASADTGEQLAQSAHEASEIGVKVVTAQCDPSDKGQVDLVVQKCLSAFGRIDVLLNNPLLPLEAQSLENISFDQWRGKLEFELTGSVQICQAVLPHMIRQEWGRIISYGGLAGFQGSDPMTSASELGIVGLTRGIAREYGKFNITANCICPGGVAAEGQFHAHLFPPGEGDPLPRWGTPGELAFLTMCLASEEAGYVTGQCLLPNGGKYFL